MNSWKRLSLSMTPGARMQMISAPNIDRLDFFPFPTREQCRREAARKEAVATGPGRLCKRHSDRHSIVWDRGSLSRAQGETMPVVSMSEVPVLEKQKQKQQKTRKTRNLSTAPRRPLLS